MYAQNKKTLILLFALILIGAVVLLVSMLAPVREQDTSIVSTEDTQISDEYVPSLQRKTITGTYECLPHVEQGEVQTMECALGIQETQTGLHYGLDLMVLQTMDLSNAPMGSQITVEGPYMPVANLSTDHWQKYNMEGILTVTSVTFN